MPQVSWSQDIFSAGELTPLMYGRVTLDVYQKALKRATNVLGYPQGPAGKRFGTWYLNTISGITSYEEIYFQSFPYLNECTYLLVFIPDKIYIYLEGILVATVSSTGIVASEIPNLDSTILENRFRVTNSLLAPKDLTRSSASANVISGVSATEITLTTPTTADLIVATQFTTSGSLPTTSPQIRTNKTYFIYTTSTTTAKIYSTAEDAKADVNAYSISGAGSGTNNAILMNTWTFSTVTFRNIPTYDFTGGYDALTFTPTATTGFGINMTASGNIFSAAYEGGAIQGNGGIARIVTYSSPTVVVMDIIEPFDNTNAIPGSQVLLTEPAWSDDRGWPQKCSSFQNRAVFANSASLSNGVWLSAVNDFDDFNDLETADDDAISYYPTSDTVNSVRFIVPYRSLTIHTNTGIYSTSLTFDQAATPANFFLSLQDSTPATAVQPRAIDNQIVVISGNDVHTLIWDGYNSSYTSNISSLASSHLFTGPIDETAYTDLERAGSRYMFITNEDGSLVIYQTLILENIQGFTKQVTEQSYGTGKFRWSASSPDGRAWFIIEREIATAQTPVSISAYGDDYLTATGVNFSTTEATRCEFTTTGTLPTTDPQIETDTYYWVLGIDADNFSIYASKEDAEADENAYTVTSAGTSSNVVPWTLGAQFFLEEISFEAYVDCGTKYSGTATSTVSDLTRFNGQEVVAQGDGYGFSGTVIDDTFTLEAHGAEVEAEEIQVGFPISLEIVPLPLAIPTSTGFKGSSLVYPQHIRTVNILCVDSIGGEINGQPITLKTLLQTVPGEAPSESTGAMEVSLMKGWSEFNRESVTITHSDPFPFKLAGLYYKVEVS